MAIAYSNEFAAQFITPMSGPPVPLFASEVYASVRKLPFTFSNPATGGLSQIGDVVHLVKVPPLCDILVPECRFTFSAWTALTTIDIGWAAYTKSDGETVEADDNGLLDGLDVDAAGEWAGGVLITAGAVARAAAVVERYAVRAKEPVILTATFRDTAPSASDNFSGYITVLVP